MCATVTRVNKMDQHCCLLSFGKIHTYTCKEKNQLERITMTLLRVYVYYINKLTICEIHNFVGVLLKPQRLA